MQPSLDELILGKELFIFFNYSSGADKLCFRDKNVYPCAAVAIYPHYMFIHQLQAKQTHA